MEARALAQLAIPGLEVLRGVAVLHDGVDAGPDLFHLFVVGVFECGQHVRRCHLLARQLHDPRANAARQIRPAVLHQILFCRAARLIGGEVLEPALLPPLGRDARKPFGIDRCVGPHVHRRWRALEHPERATVSGEVRHALHRSGTGADQRHAPVGQLVHRRAESIAARVVIVPAAGVKRMALERLDAGDARQLGHVQRPGAHADELRGERIAAIAADEPQRALGVPREVLHFGVEERLVVQPVLAADALAVREDLRPARVLLRRHVPGFLQQRHVDHRRRVALRAGVAVPVPGAAEIAALLDDAHIADAGLDQARCGHQPGEAAADEREGHVIGARRARRARRVGVFEVVGQPALELQVLLVAIGAQALGALLEVLATQRGLVGRAAERAACVVGHRHATLRDSNQAADIGAPLRDHEE